MPRGAPQSTGRHHRIAILGEGGMARVYLMVSQGPMGFDKLLVVKELKPELMNEPEFLAMFSEEARIAARLHHPNVIQTYEVHVEGDRHVIVMEYLEGHALSALLARCTREKMPLDVHLAVLIQALAGLHYAHELADFDGTPLSVVHRDVSPHNLIVTYDGNVKLVDFGIAKTAKSVSLTKSGVFKGKVVYVAPEQACALPVDRRADIFAMGVMLWEALAGRRLVPHGELDFAIVNRRAAGQDPRIREVKPQVPAELADICDRAMATRPDERFATAAEFQAALVRFMEGAGMRVGAPEIGALVSETFEEERTQLRALIKEHMRLVRLVRVGRLLPTLRLDRALPEEDTGPTEGPELPNLAPPSSARGAEEDSRPMLLTEDLTTAARARPWLPWAVAATSLLVVVVGVFLVMQSSRPAATGSAAKPLRAPSASGATPALHEPGAAPMIQLSISVEPPEAQAFLDDIPLAGNPFRASVPRDGLMHRLRASAAGFTTEEQLIAFKGDRVIAFALEREGPGEQGSSRPRVATPPPRPPNPSPVIDEKAP